MNKKRLFSLMCLMLLPSLAFASNGSGFELNSILQGLINLLSSTVARTIFVLAIIGVGYGWLYMGRIPKGAAISAIAGIGIVFSAPYIAQTIGVMN